MTTTPVHADVVLRRMVAKAQAHGRVPAVQAAIFRADRPLWTMQVGTTGNDTALDEQTQFRIGSVTKTFTAVLVLQCRDDGLLDLDDPISRHLDVPALGQATVRTLLAHTAGYQREPYGDVWDTMLAPDAAELLDDLARCERVLAPGRRFHYSNLGFAVLGQLVARLRGSSWEQLVIDRVTTPLGLASITVQPTGRAAVGHLVDAYSDHVRPEPATDFKGVGPAAQLWGTATDLAKWAAFLNDPATVDPDGAVLSATTLEEMRWPHTTSEEAVWASGMGLGLMLAPGSGRVLQVGHYGAMPGFLAAVFGQRGGADTPRGFGAAVLGSAGNGDTVIELVHQLLTKSVELDPAEIAPWHPGEPVPTQYRSVLGRWWSEGFEHEFHWRNGALQSRAAGAPAGRPPSVFALVDGDPDLLRTVSGRECGELLRLTRDAAGEVVRMNWATYRFTRAQETFDGINVSHG